MTETPAPEPQHLPSSAQLLRSTAIASAVAAALLATTVLPAEYGIDPTGVGRLLGLTQMGEIKVALAKEADGEPEKASVQSTAAGAEPAPGAPPEIGAPVAAEWHETIVALAANEAAEVKVEMRAGRVVAYEWFTDGAKVNFDLHGDAPGIDYFRYARGSDANAKGDLRAEFDGAHGWFWRNRSGGPVTVTLRVRGDYTAVRRVV